VRRRITRVRRPQRIAGLTALVGALLIGASGARAELTTPKCLAGKLKAWADLRKCQRLEEAKQVLGKPSDLAKCQTKWNDKIATLDEKAESAGIACRYRDNGDSTVTDLATGLMWERKNDVTVTQEETWTVALTDFLGSCNGTSLGGTSLGPGCSVYRDWRIPNILELKTILDLSRVGCGGAAAACIDPIFEPTARGIYWSATSSSADPTMAWNLSFERGDVRLLTKTFTLHVRAVRSAL
jgi:hypothetical protein